MKKVSIKKIAYRESIRVTKDLNSLDLRSLLPVLPPFLTLGSTYANSNSTARVPYNNPKKISVVSPISLIIE
ncbi:hypothetical protein [Metallosphaera javensis (ex Hofmann et al. 2022)]|uniref:hypothetical protein n=1 Tax=Metallosphaera javensis (ex Hofmann et al. 2022) TaxID=99938 RepID=UPI001EDED13B|nr:hypothetical protein [Metallosphaera javensis (ex Hofmann et al. 2022)]